VFVLKTALVTDGQILYVDTIEYEGELWLVPEWTESRDEGWSKPVRMVCLSRLRHHGESGKGHPDFVLDDPIPKAVLFGPTPPSLGGAYRVVEHPDITFPYLPGLL
jgi:hypothetical protein